MKPVFIERNKNIIIEFDKIFQNPDMADYDLFRLAIGKKRVYAGMADLLCKKNNEILALDKNVANQVIYAYFNIKKAINDKLFVKVDSAKDLVTKYGQNAKRDFGKYENFLNFLVSNLYTRDFINLVKKYVADNYTPINEKDSEQYTAGTTFNNEHFQLMYTVSILSRFAIPLCTHYIYVNSDKNIEVFDFMYTIFAGIFKIVVIDSNCTDLMNKLYQFIDRIVRRTQNSNRLIWDKFPMYNDTQESITHELVVKIVTTILPRFALDQSIISLIAVVARDSVALYKIKAKNPYDCYRINDNDSSADEEDKLSETDIFDLYYRPQDENIQIINKFANDDAVNVLARRNHIEFDQKEINYYKKNFKIHYFTVNLVTQVFARFFSGTANVRSCNPEQFIKLMIILVRKMRDLDINYLPDFVTADRESYSFVRIPSAGILKSLKNNIDYIELVEMKYRFVRNIFDIKTTNGDSRNPIKDMIVSLVHNEYKYNSFGDKHNGEKIPIDENKIINDVLAIYKKMIL